MHWAGNLKIDTVCPTGWFKLASLGYTTLNGIIIVGSIMGDSKVGRLKTAIVGGLLATVTAVFVIVVLSFGLFPEGDFPMGDAELPSKVVYYCIMAGFVLAGGILILRRRYRLGGIFALAFSIVLLIQGGFILIPSVVGGILALRSKE